MAADDSGKVDTEKGGPRLSITINQETDSADDHSNDTVQWTQVEEERLVRRLDLTVMPLLMLGFFVLQLDRANSGNALTDFLLRDIGITQFQFNVGNQMMYLGIIIFEIPSNLVLYRIGPALWIGVQILAWGLVATFQAFIKGKGLGPYIVTRFLLGACESGYIPAGLFTIKRLYKTEELSKRFSIFFLGNMTANGCAGLIAYGILHMRGVAGLSGWQWLFLIEGLLTIGVAFLFIAIFPQSTEKPISLLGLRYFDQREADILTQRVLRDDPTKIHVKTHVSKEELKAALTNWRLIGHIVTIIAGISATTSLYTFAPSIVASYGYGRLKANAMVTIGFWLLLVTNIAWGVIADRWGRRGPMVFLGVAIGWALVANRLIVRTDNFDAKFALLTLIAAFSVNWHPVHGSWIALNTKSPGERSVTMAIFIMSANVSGIVGGQVFQAADAPRYQTAWSVLVALSCLAVTAAALTNFQYWYLNRRNAKKSDQGFTYNL